MTNMQPSKTLELEFTILNFYRDYVISSPREGKILEAQEIADLVEVCSDFYETRNFAYLSFRVNDYNVNPLIYLNINEVRNLAGIGVICHLPSSLRLAKFEKRFSSVPFEIFEELDEALEWVDKIISEKNKKADL